MTSERKDTERVSNVPDTSIVAQHNNPMSAQTTQEALLVGRPGLAIARECEPGSYFLHVRSQISPRDDICDTCDTCGDTFAFGGHVTRGKTVVMFL